MMMKKLFLSIVLLFVGVSFLCSGVDSIRIHHGPSGYKLDPISKKVEDLPNGVLHTLRMKAGLPNEQIPPPPRFKSERATTSKPKIKQATKAKKEVTRENTRKRQPMTHAEASRQKQPQR